MTTGNEKYIYWKSHIKSSWSIEVSSSLNLVVITIDILLDAWLGSCWCWSTFIATGPSCLRHNLIEGPGPYVVLPVVSNLHLDCLTRLLLAILLEKLPIHKSKNSVYGSKKRRETVYLSMSRMRRFSPLSCFSFRTSARTWVKLFLSFAFCVSVCLWLWTFSIAGPVAFQA